MDARMKARRELEMDLRNALANKEFELHYQPLVNLQSNEISAFEALVRWHHPERGLISPAEFIPVAEETGLIIPLGEWVLRTACEETANWPNDVKVAVNLSPAQLKSRNVVQMVTSALEDSGMAGRRLQLEITESVLMQNTFSTLATLHELRKLGVQIAMDDFGTGYSSLSYLRSFPFDKIKIDRSFIEDLSNGAEPLAIVHAVAGLAKCLNMISTAEGVETQQQLDKLHSIGCTEMQGYLFSRARPAGEIAQLFVSQAERARGAA
jgi:EAL domain-containing protein (putative c-di-GMP-specific phosphodiesterase class I)